MAFQPAPLRRPRVDRPSHTNNSSIAGGIFGTETGFRAPVRPNTGDDFLQQLEQAEQRDNRVQQSMYTGSSNAYVPAPRPGAYKAVEDEQERAYQRRLQQERGNIVFGDDSSPWNQPVRRQMDSRFQTTNQLQQEQARKVHEEALQRHEEKVLMEIMVEQYGMSTKEARHEIDLYHREQQQQQQQAGGGGGAPPRGQPPPPPQQQQPWQQQPRQQPQWPQQQQQPQPQQRSLLSLSPAEQQSYHQQRQLQQQQQRQGHAFGARRTAQHPGIPRTNAQAQDRNGSSLDGGIFAPGVWS